MNYDELLKLAEYCLKIKDIPSLFIISHLLVNFHLDAYENKITIYRSFRNLIGHTDQSVSWNDDMVANARTFANKILLPIIAWRER